MRTHSPSAGTPRRKGWARVVASLAALASIGVAVPMIASTGSASALGKILPGGLNVSGAIPTASQFDVTGFIQAATVDSPLDPHSGGTITINGQVIVVPRELIAILPANALTWQQLFAEAPAPYGGTQSGLAEADTPHPLASYQANVVGNRVAGRACLPGNAVVATSDCYIAGLIHISQLDLNSGAGYISYIDYNVSGQAEMRVGGLINDPLCVPNPANTVAGGPSCSGTRVRINDPAVAGSTSGRFGRAYSPDPRFQVDQDNPTIQAATGYPMCLPRGLVDPTNNLDTAGIAGAAPTYTSVDDTDAACPLTNRVSRSDGFGNVIVGAMVDPTQPGGFATTTNTGAGLAVVQGYVADATAQIPMEVGDYITYAGNVVNDSATPTAEVAGATTFIAAHTIVNNFAAYTRPGVNPAYVSIEVSLIGTGGLTVFGAGEAAVRTRFEGMSTDPSRNVHVYGIDLDKTTGATTDRDWGVITPDPGPPGGAVEGRWRMRPPCKAVAGGAVTDKICSLPPQGDYLPPTREVRAVIDGGVGSTVDPATLPNPQTPGFVAPITAASPTAANGIVYGQYHAPIGEYIFPENIPGNPIPPNNFETIPFLAAGGYTSGGANPTRVGQLNPWPGATVPGQAVCAVALPGGPYTVPQNGSVVLTGNAGTGVTGTVSFTWSAPTPAIGSFVTNVGQSVTFNAGLGAAVGTQVTVTLTVTQNNAPGCPLTVTSAPVTITVGTNPSLPTMTSARPSTTTVNTVNANNITLQAQGQFHHALNSGAQTQTGFYTFIQTGGPSVTLPNGGKTGNFSCSLATNVTSCNVPQGSITFPVPVGTVAFGANALKFVAVLTSTTANSTSTALGLSTITATPTVATNITLTTVQYRQSNQRLDITATYTGGDALAAGNALAAVLKLQPYLTVSGTWFNPATLGNTFTNTGAGIYTITIVGAQPPACNGVGAAYVTPCSNALASVVVEAQTAPTARPANVIEGISLLPGTALTNIR